jgi:cytochrome b involved in lipid metabolism/ferredoxin-NADP reductase
MVLSRQVLTEAEDYYLRTGDELEGFLSEETGFLPRRAAELSLPDSHRAWDEIAAALPALWRDLGVRAAVRELPALRGTEDVLPSRYVRRASTILSILAHSYVYSERDPYGDLPVVLEQAWADVGRRLGKPEPFLRYEDLVLANWWKPDAAAPLTVEHLEYLVPSVGIQTERLFYLSQVEVHARATPLVGSVVRAQEAIARGDDEATEAELLLMIETVRALIDEVLIKLDPNAHSPTAVDPVLFGVIVADLAVPLKPTHPGPSGTAAPVFHVLDAFLGRTTFESQIGLDAVRLRKWGPKAVERFVAAIAQGPGASTIMTTGSRRLRGLLQTLVELYSGPRGWLEAHRLKVYGFIEMSFKAGRPVTIGGFGGEFHDRPWRTVHTALDESRAERELDAQMHSAKGVLTERGPAAAGAGVKQVVLDVRDEGVVYRSGDRCQILPANSAEHVLRTLRALKANGDEPVPLTAWWRLALRRRAEADAREQLPLEEFLRYAKLRPLLRRVAKALVRVSGSPSLHGIVESRREDELELWEALELIAADGYDVAELWSSTEAKAESLATIVPPETFRLYSISSGGAEGIADEIELTVETVTYPSGDGREPRLRRGTASGYLTETAPLGASVPITIVRPPRFQPPADDQIPMVLLAEDIGIAPLRGILRARATAAEPGPAWLFFLAPTRDGGPSRDELQRLGDPGWLSVEVAFSDEGDTVEQLIVSEANAALLRPLIRPAEQGGRDAQVYVSGRDAFVRAVTGALREVGSAELIRKLAAEQRLMFQVSPTHASRHGPRVDGKGTYDTSELVLHNDADHGYWVALDGDVCDMTEFRHLHPGGSYIVDASAGIDASEEYATVLHHRDPEINAMLAMYKLGTIRRLHFDGAGDDALHELYRSWVRYLFLVVEMQNAFENDLVCLDAQTTAVESPDELTPLKLMLFSKTNDRFVELYYRGLSASPVWELWRASAALSDPPEDGSWMERELQRLGASNAHDLERVQAELRNLWEQGRGGRDDETFWSGARAAVTELSNCDRRFIAGMKAAVREGLEVFERHERDTVEHAGSLLEALRKVPEVVENYHRELAGVSLPADASGEPERATAPD